MESFLTWTKSWGSINGEPKRCQRAAVKHRHEQPKKCNDRPERHGSNGADDSDAGIYQHACLKSVYASYQSPFVVASLSCKIVHLYESSFSAEAWLVLSLCLIRRYRCDCWNDLIVAHCLPSDPLNPWLLANVTSKNIGLCSCGLPFKYWTISKAQSLISTGPSARCCFSNSVVPLSH